MKNSVASVKGSGEVLDNTIDSAGDRVSAIEVERSGHGNKMEVWQVIHEIEGIFTEKDKSLFIEDSTIFFTTQPKFSRFEKLMLAFLNDFIRLFKRQNCFSHIFQVYQKDRAVIREYLSFIRLGPEIECPLENYVEIQPYLGTPEKSNSPQQEKTDCPHDSIHKTSNLDALNLILPDGIKLTDIQSKVVGSIIYNDKNVLISAPTGSGKTLLAIVGINNCLKSRRSGKVYYIAPMKVLIKQKVIEITEWINQKMSDTGDMGYQVIGLSSDFKTEHSQIISSDVIVGTPEKLDILLRNGHKFDLVVVDEVHLLFYDRGDVIEAIVARINCRIIAMSATIPDTELVRRFLRVPEYNCFNFDDNYRPIKVKYEYNPVENNNESRKLVVSRAINENKPLLLFVNERQSTWEIAEEIVNKICKSKSLNCRFCSNDGVDSTKVDEPSILARTSLLDSDDVTSLIDQIKDFSLFRLVAHGVGIHNAALRRNYRYVVERLFLLKAIGILVSTATLSWGVNLPCNTVIVYGEFSALDIVQMCGRAGRGVPSEEQAAGQYLACFYGKEIQDKSAQAGYLQKNICFHINAEICMGRIRSLTEAFEWLRKTFLYQKIKQKIENENREHSNPGENVGLCTVENDIRDIDSLIEKKVRNTIYQALIQMEQRRLVEHFEPTLLGRISHKFYLKLEDLEMLKSINVLFDESLFLELLGCMLEGAVKVTLPNIQVPYPTDLAVNKLLQFLLAGYNVSVDATSLLQNVLRLLSAAFEYSLAMKITSACNALQLYHRFTACVKMLNTRNSHNPTINKSNKSALKHFCKLECDNFATLLYFSTERSVFEDISINAVAYKNSDFVFLSINISAAECVQIRHIILLVSDSMDHHVLYSKVLSGTTVKVYLDGDDNMFYSLRLVSRHYAAVLKTTVLVTEAPRRPDLLSEASFRIYQEGCTHLPEYNYLVVLDDASSGDRKDVVTYYELNHIIYSEAHIISKFCVVETIGLEIEPETSVFSPLGELKDSSSKYIEIILAIRRGGISFLLSELHYSDENPVILSVILGCIKYKLKFDCLFVDFSKISRILKFINIPNIPWISDSENSLDVLFRNLVLTYADGLNVVLCESKEDSRKLCTLYNRYLSDNFIRILYTSCDERIPEGCTVFFSVFGFGEIPSGTILHILFEDISFSNVIDVSKYAKCLYLYTSKYEKMNVETQIKYDVHMKIRQKCNEKNNCEVRMFEIDNQCELKDTLQADSLIGMTELLYGSGLQPPSLDLKYYSNLKDNGEERIAEVFIKYAMDSCIFNELLVNFKNGMSLKSIFKLIFGILSRNKRHVRFNMSEWCDLISNRDYRNLVSGCLESMRGRFTSEAYIEGQKIINDEDNNIDFNLERKLRIEVRRYLQCLVEICFVKKYFKTIITLIYALQRINNHKENFFRITIQNESGRAFVPSNSSISVENTDESLEEYLKCAGNYAKTSFKRAGSARRNIKTFTFIIDVLKMPGKEVFFYLIDEAYGFKILRVYHSGKYVVSWPGGVYVLCSHGHGSVHLNEDYDY